MGELGFNKIFGAILATFLFIFGLNEVATRVFGGGAHHGDHHHENDKEWAKANFHGWEDVVAVSATSGDAVEEAVFDLGLALANADPAAGEAALKGQCAACHSWNEGGANGVGPNLHGIINKQIASKAGFSYSSALSGKGGQWTYEDMNAWLTNPGAYARGTSMAFAGLRSPRRDGQRMDIIAYLASTTANAPAFPAPLATEASEETAPEATESPVESNVVEGSVEEATDAAGTLAETAEGIAADAGEAGNAAIEQATEAATEAGETFAEEGNALLQDAADTAEDAKDAAENAVEDATDGEH